MRGREWMDRAEEETIDPLDQFCWFKKHFGETWREVLEEDPEYVQFILYETDLYVAPVVIEALEMGLEDG